MNSLDFEDQPSPRHNIATLLLNILTVMAILGVLCNIVLFLMLFNSPNSTLNPFPPPTLPVALALPTYTPTPLAILPATWTPTVTLEPTATEAPRATGTLPLTETPFSIATPSTPTRPATGYRFVMKSDRPLSIPNISYPDKGCNWMGVAGQVYDISGGPKTQVIVELGGFLDNKLVDPASGTKITLTGTSPQYGQAGYEFVLADHPITSAGTLWIQLVDQANTPLSDKIYFDTYDTCDKNLIIISFKEVR